MLHMKWFNIVNMVKKSSILSSVYWLRSFPVVVVHESNGSAEVVDFESAKKSRQDSSSTAKKRRVSEGGQRTQIEPKETPVTPVSFVSDMPFQFFLINKECKTQLLLFLFSSIRVAELIIERVNLKEKRLLTFIWKANSMNFFQYRVTRP